MYPSESSGCLRLDGNVLMGVCPRPQHSVEYLCFVHSLAGRLEGQTPLNAVYSAGKTNARGQEDPPLTGIGRRLFTHRNRLPCQLGREIRAERKEAICVR